MKARIIVVSSLIVLGACGAEAPHQTAAENLPPVNSAQTPVSCELPKIDGWCQENAWWKPLGGGCMIKKQFDPSRPNTRLVMMQPKLIASLTSFSCQAETTNGYTDWKLVNTALEDPNEYILNAIYESHVDTVLDGDASYRTGYFWYESQADLSVHRYFNLEPQVAGSSTSGAINPLSNVSYKNYLVCFRTIDVQ